MNERLLYRAYYDYPEGYQFTDEGDDKPSSEELLKEYTRRRIRNRQGRSAKVVPIKRSRKKTA